MEAAARVGGGVASDADALDGVVRDARSSVHPFGAASPAFGELGLDRHGLEWMHPPIALAHPIDGAGAAVLDRDLETAAATLGADAGAG